MEAALDAFLVFFFVGLEGLANSWPESLTKLSFATFPEMVALEDGRDIAWGTARVP